MRLLIHSFIDCPLGIPNGHRTGVDCPLGITAVFWPGLAKPGANSHTVGLTAVDRLDFMARAKPGHGSAGAEVQLESAYKVGSGSSLCMKLYA
jgi:hypothetical protein